MPQIKSGGGLLFYLYLSQKIIYRAQPLPHHPCRAELTATKSPENERFRGF